MRIDTVDQYDHVKGAVQRGAVFQQKDAFRVVHIFIFDDHRRLLLQQLSARRDRHPLRWGSSVAAYLFSGETYRKAAKRRLAQELGVNLNLRLVGRTSMVDQGVPKFISLFQAAGGTAQLRPDPDPIASVKWCALGEIDRAVRDAPEQFTPTFMHVYRFFCDSAKAP
jgi:isopentenyl-diphosphate delta-isomerase